MAGLYQDWACESQDQLAEEARRRLDKNWDVQPVFIYGKKKKKVFLNHNFSFAILWR